MEQEIFLIVLVSGEKIISKVEQISTDLGEPDCKLIDPYLIENDTIVPWLNTYTNDTQIMISSDKILTLVEPKGLLSDQYLEKIK